MPQLYPTKILSKRVNFASDGPSHVPHLVEEKPADFLHSRYFHANIKEKSRSSPSNFNAKQEFSKTLPEKQKPPVMSMFRRMHLEDISDRGLMHAKNTRLFFYISQKFITKFGSAHKKCISAAVEDFLTDHQDDNIDINDLRILDSIIYDSIMSRNGDEPVLSNSLSQNDFHYRNKNKSGTSRLQGSASTGTMDPLPLGSDWKIIRNHRSLTTEDRENSDIDFTKSTKEKFDDSLASIAHASNGTVKLTEIENYRPDDYMRESVKIFCDDEINRQKRLHLKKIAEYQYQEMQSQDIKLRQKMEKESRIIQQERETLFKEENQLEEQKQILESKARAIEYKERIQLELNQTLDRTFNNSTYKRYDQSLKERLQEDSDRRIHKKKTLPGFFKLNHKSFGQNLSNTIEKYSLSTMGETFGSHIGNQEDNGERFNRQFRSTDDMDNTQDNIAPNVVSYKLSQRTFKKTVLKKQEDYKADLRNQAIEQKNNLVDFQRPFGMGDRPDKNPDKIGNMPHATVNRGYAVGHMTLNKAYFINRDREKYSRSNSTL